MSLAWWTLSFLRPYRVRVAVIAILSLAEIGIAALTPWPLKLIVDNILGDHPLPGPVARFTATTGWTPRHAKFDTSWFDAIATPRSVLQ